MEEARKDDVMYLQFGHGTQKALVTEVIEKGYMVRRYNKKMKTWYDKESFIKKNDKRILNIRKGSGDSDE